MRLPWFDLVAVQSSQCSRPHQRLTAKVKRFCNAKSLVFIGSDSAESIEGKT